MRSEWPGIGRLLRETGRTLDCRSGLTGNLSQDRRSLKPWICPQLSVDEWRLIARLVSACTLVACIFGALHDQITFTLSPEYFQKIKFQQFAWLSFGRPDRLRVAAIGSVACAGLGALFGWLLGRRLLQAKIRPLPTTAAKDFWRAARRRCLLVLSCAVAGGLIAGICAHWLATDGNGGRWDWAIEQYRIVDRLHFIEVVYVHHGSYLGALLGAALALVSGSTSQEHDNIRPESEPASGNRD